MRRIIIGCPNCGERLEVEYRIYPGHILTEEASAVERAIRKHICPTYQERVACQSQNELK